MTRTSFNKDWIVRTPAGAFAAQRPYGCQGQEVGHREGDLSRGAGDEQLLAETPLASRLFGNRGRRPAVAGTRRPASGRRSPPESRSPT